MDELAHDRRHAGDLRQRRRFEVDVRLQHLGAGLRGPRQPPGQQPVEQQAQGVHVGGGDDRVAVEPLRRQVRRRPQDVGVLLAVALAGHRRETEVDHLRAARGEHHVARLHVAVHQPVGVRRGERGGHLRADAQRHLHRQVAALEPFVQRAAVQQLHHDVRDEVALGVLGLAVVVDARDVRVGEPGRRPRLGERAPPRVGVAGVLGRQQLHRHLTIEHLVIGAPDHAHAARAEDAPEAVAGSENLIGHECQFAFPGGGR